MSTANAALEGAEISLSSAPKRSLPLDFNDTPLRSARSSASSAEPPRSPLKVELALNPPSSSWPGEGASKATTLAPSPAFDAPDLAPAPCCPFAFRFHGGVLPMGLPFFFFHGGSVSGPSPSDAAAASGSAAPRPPSSSLSLNRSAEPPALLPDVTP